MTASVDAARASLIDALEQIDEPVDRYAAVKDFEAQLDLDLKRVKANIAKSLYEGRSWRQVGDLLGVTGSRAEQISRGAR